MVQDALGCEQTLNSITIEEEFSVELELPVSIEVGFEEFTELFPVISGEVTGLSYEWSSPDMSLLSCITCPDPEIGPISQNTMVTLTVTNDFGCTAVATTNIFVDKEVIIKVPTAFTPDNNGVNDLLNVFGREGTIVTRFDVYTRWGELVYSNPIQFMINDKSIGWDGRFQGVLLDAGVYNYMVEAVFVDGTEKFVKGQTTLLR
jgi:gliding motility-associated-like protein